MGLSATEVRLSTGWADAQERGTYHLMRLMFWGLQAMRRPLLMPLVRAVTIYFFLFGSTARKASLDYLRRIEIAMPSTGLRSNWRTSFRHFSAFGDAILDKFDAWAGRLPIDSLVFNNSDEIGRCFAAGRGGLIIGTHLGNAEVCRALAGINGVPKLNVLAHTRHAASFNRLLGMAGASGFELLQVTELDMAQAFALRERIEAGEWVVIAGDRAPVHGGRTVGIPLLGATAALPIGPYVLGAFLECPVFLMFCLRRSGRYHVYFEAFAEKVSWSRPGREAVIKALAARFVLRLEHYIRLEPLQWFNFYQFWGQSRGNVKGAAGPADLGERAVR